MYTRARLYVFIGKHAYVCAHDARVMRIMYARRL